MDSELSDKLGIKVHRTERVDGTVTAESVVIDFNVLEYGLAKFITGGEVLAVDGLNLQRGSGVGWAKAERCPTGSWSRRAPVGHRTCPTYRADQPFNRIA